MLRMQEMAFLGFTFQKFFGGAYPRTPLDYMVPPNFRVMLRSQIFSWIRPCTFTIPFGNFNLAPPQKFRISDPLGPHQKISSTGGVDIKWNGPRPPWCINCAEVKAEQLRMAALCTILNSVFVY